MAIQSFSEPFIRRPVGTTLLAIGLLLVGAVAYRFLPVASMPTIEFPTISVTASRPGADPETMAATVAAPLERRLGEIPGVTELTSRSSLGSTRISVQFDLSRSIDGAARDVQAALNAALTDLPGDLQSRPTFRKSNPAATPVMILALTSKTVPPSALYDAADTVIAQRLSQVDGVAEVSVNGAEQPAIRVRVNPIALASMGLDMENVRTAIANTNAAGALGVFDGDERAVTIGINDQLRTASDYDPIVVRTANGAVVRLSAVASIEAERAQQPLGRLVQRPALGAAGDHQAGQLQRHRDGRPHLPAAAGTQALDSGRASTSRCCPTGPRPFGPASTTCSSRCSRPSALVMLVVFVFLRRAAATIAAGVTVPLSLAGTCAAMWVTGLLDRQSLADGARRIGRLRGRRRHRDDRELLPQSRKGHVADDGRHRGRAPDRLHGAGDQHLADRRLHPAAVHDRHRRAGVPRILRDARVCDHGLDRGVADGHADDLRAFRAQAAEPGRHLVRPRGRARPESGWCGPTAKQPGRRAGLSAGSRWSSWRARSRSPPFSMSARRRASSRRTIPG